jgi:hypothetical protein
MTWLNHISGSTGYVSCGGLDPLVYFFQERTLRDSWFGIRNFKGLVYKITSKTGKWTKDPSLIKEWGPAAAVVKYPFFQAVSSFAT